jgi:FkbM family methyltransferase
MRCAASFYRMFQALVSFVVDMLHEEDISLTLVDVGSRGGVTALREVADVVDVYGFEPNQTEYEKLVRARASSPLPYRSLNVFPWAIAEADGVAELKVTRHPGASSFLEPNLERLEEITWKEREHPSGYSELFEVVERRAVPTRSLAGFAREQGIGHVDCLKLDVEGLEYEVLQGARPLLPNIGVIRAEVSFIPFRQRQKLFSDVDQLLRGFCFDLLRYEIRPTHIGYKARTTATVFGPEVGFADPYGQALQADAVYVNRGICDRQRLIAQAAVLIDENYLDEAAFVLHRAGRAKGPLFDLLVSHREARFEQRIFDKTMLVGRAARAPRALLRRFVKR